MIDMENNEYKCTPRCGGTKDNPCMIAVNRSRAREKDLKAFEAFIPVRDAYRAGKITEDAFLVARAKYKAAADEYEEALLKAERIRNNKGGLNETD